MSFFYIADLHIGHANVIKFDNRPYSDLNEMHNTIVDNWNRVVRGNDTVYILGDFCWGNHLFDVAMVYVCCCLSDEAFISETFHMPKALAGKFWEHFAPAYFGSDRPLKDIEEEILPYAGLKTLIIERDMKEPMPVFREALKSVL